MQKSTPRERPPFSWKARGRSFSYAWSGIRHFFRTEHNAWLHLGATCGVVLAALMLGVSRTEAIALVFAVSLVWITEMLNTAVEKALDHLSPAIHPQVKVIKDVAAGAVLVAALAALVVGTVIFLPKLLQL